MSKGNPFRRTKAMLERLRKPMRVVFIDPKDLSERTSFTLSLGRIYLLLSSMVLLLILGTATLTLTTPIKYYLPGYGDPSIRKELVMIHQKLDSLHQVLHAHQQFEDHLKIILEGQSVPVKDTLKLPSKILEKEAKKNLLPLPLIREEALEHIEEQNRSET